MLGLASTGAAAGAKAMLERLNVGQLAVSENRLELIRSQVRQAGNNSLIAGATVCTYRANWHGRLDRAVAEKCR